MGTEPLAEQMLTNPTSTPRNTFTGNLNLNESISLMEIHSKLSSARWRPCRLSLNVVVVYVQLFPLLPFKAYVRQLSRLAAHSYRVSVQSQASTDRVRSGSFLACRNWTGAASIGPVLALFLFGMFTGVKFSVSRENS